MRTDAVIAIVGAHDARNPASRLTMPVSDETAGPGSWARRVPAANTGTAGRRLASARPPHFSVAASQQARQPAVAEDAAAGHSMPREDVMTEPAAPYPHPGPATSQAAPVPRRHRTAHAIGGHERAQTTALRRKIAHDDAQNHPPPVTSALPVNQKLAITMRWIWLVPWQVWRGRASARPAGRTARAPRPPRDRRCRTSAGRGCRTRRPRRPS